MTIYHKHHIIPRHAGGSDHISNLIELTVKQHAEAHRTLFLQHGRWQDEVAWKCLSGQINKDEARRMAVSKSLSGVEKTTEHKSNISKAQQKRYQEIGGHPNKGGSNPPASDERKQKISKALKGKQQNKVECPHCGKSGGKPMMDRWHFDKCKLFTTLF